MKLLIFSVLAMSISSHAFATSVCHDSSQKYQVELKWDFSSQELKVIRNGTVLVNAKGSDIKTSKENGQNHFRTLQGSYDVDLYFTGLTAGGTAAVLDLAGGDDNEEADTVQLVCKKN